MFLIFGKSPDEVMYLKWVRPYIENLKYLVVLCYSNELLRMVWAKIAQNITLGIV